FREFSLLLVLNPQGNHPCCQPIPVSLGRAKNSDLKLSGFSVLIRLQNLWLLANLAFREPSPFCPGRLAESDLRNRFRFDGPAVRAWNKHKLRPVPESGLAERDCHFPAQNIAHLRRRLEAVP